VAGEAILSAHTAGSVGRGSGPQRRPERSTAAAGPSPESHVEGATIRQDNHRDVLAGAIGLMPAQGRATQPGSRRMGRVLRQRPPAIASRPQPGTSAPGPGRVQHSGRQDDPNAARPPPDRGACNIQGVRTTRTQHVRPRTAARATFRASGAAAAGVRGMQGVLQLGDRRRRQRPTSRRAAQSDSARCSARRRRATFPAPGRGQPLPGARLSPSCGAPPGGGCGGGRTGPGRRGPRVPWARRCPARTGRCRR
jgi:hypothetical protein